MYVSILYIYIAVNDSDLVDDQVSMSVSSTKSSRSSMLISQSSLSDESDLHSSVSSQSMTNIQRPRCRGSRGQGRGRRGLGGGRRGRGIRRRGQGMRGRRGRSSRGHTTSVRSSNLSAATIAVLNEIGFEWKKEEPTSYTQPYTIIPGPVSPAVTSQSSPQDLFSRFFTDAVWDHIVVETNRYANSFGLNNPDGRTWTDTTVEEMKAFVGLLICMGIVRLPRLELYWSSQFSLIKTPGISTIMPLRRFEQIWRFLHLTDNNLEIAYGQPGYDKLFKVRKLLDLLCPRFESEFELHQSCTIDEAMIPFKGRLKFKQYMKDKTTKWGIKVFVLADSITGYVKRLQVYTGKGFVLQMWGCAQE